MTIHFSDISTAEQRLELENRRIYRVRSFYNQTAKRWLDIALVLVAVPVVLPVVALMAVLVALDGHNPFYSQMRLGRGGRAFRIWKMRTMVPNADKALEAYLSENPSARAEWDATQKLRDDPRITRVGAVLRKCSLDELPQLWNVLTGAMSLVGPRPMMPCQQELYPGRAYYALRPGITGPWQVSERNDSMFAGRAAFDDDYARSVSLRTDLQLLTQTVGVVLRGTGH